MAEVAPVPWTTIPEMMRDVAQRHASLEAVVDGEVRLDFAALHREALRVASALRAAGIAPGDRVAIWASNGWRWVVAASGIWQLGAVVVPLASRWKVAEVAPLLARTEARLLFLERESAGERPLDALREERGTGTKGAPGEADRPIADLPTLERIVVFENGASADRSGSAVRRGEGIVAWDAFLEAGADLPTPDGRDADPKAIAQLLFTSGTTGSPKGVALDQRQLLQAYWDWSGIGGLGAGDRFLVIPPYSHGFGMNGGILACWMRAVANVPIAVFDPKTALRLIAQERISVISGPPTLFATLMNLEGFDPKATSSLRLAFVGAAAVPTELILAMRERMGIERVVNAYGLIEVCVVSMTRASDPAEVIATTTGRAMPGVEVRLVAADGRIVEDGEPGEVQVRSQGVMRGYWRDPEQTAAAITPEGWCRTGDVGVRDAEGHIRVVDRLKDAYNCGGFSAFPAEIENALLGFEAVAQVAVVGVPDARLGEVGHAFVVPAAGRSLDAEALLAFARKHMANYKVPRRIHVLASFPLNANGKVRKDELRRRAIEAIEAG
jgi:acyl-CoA synthetase (AMP-forming)/AMP-acid ligase II